MATLVEQLSAYAEALRYEELPAEVVRQARRLIVDTLGCALGGYGSTPARIARELAATVTATEPASLLVSGQRSSPELAVFANGVAIRFLDFNDGYTSSGESGHPSDSIAAALTAAELKGRGGRDLITATVLAYEVFCRVCDAVDLKPHFDHVTVGGMASTAAVARLLGLPRERIAAALNLDVASNIALYQTRIGHVSMWKGCAYANASRNAMFACRLAERGMSGPAPVFEGEGGYFKAVSRVPFALPAWGGPGHGYKIMECSIKRFPLGQYSQTIAQAALEVRPRIASPDDIAEVRIATLTTAVRIMANDPEKWEPETRETADHSMPYTAAVALVHGAVEQQHFEDPTLHDPSVRALTRRVKIEILEEADRRMPEAMLCRLTVVMKSGETHAAEVAYHRGHWRNPMSDGEVEDKFRGLAAGVLPQERTDRLLAALWKLETVADTRELMRLATAN